MKYKDMRKQHHEVRLTYLYCSYTSLMLCLPSIAQRLGAAIGSRHYRILHYNINVKKCLLFTVRRPPKVQNKYDHAEM